jgi:catechol 2,3-dioxygenase-like lactoylglutathione lyase family enzyme
MFEGRVSQVTVLVRDQAASLDFFTTKVGFEKKTDFSLPAGGRWVTVGPAGHDLELALYPLGSNADPQQRAREQEWRPGTAPPIVIRVGDCRKVHAELSARGVSFPQPPQQYPWGTVATFADPDGNLFSIAQLPEYPARK